METLIILMYCNLFMLGVSGILFVGAYNKYTHASYLNEEVRKLATRVLLIKNKR